MYSLLMYLDYDFTDLEAKMHHNFWTKVGNSGHSDVAWFFFISHKKMARLAGQSALPLHH